MRTRRYERHKKYFPSREHSLKCSSYIDEQTTYRVVNKKELFFYVKNVIYFKATF